MEKGEISSIKDLLQFVWESKFSDFYRGKYISAGFSKKDVLNPKNFIKLPFLTREELEATPPDNRLFISPKEVQFIAYTSGTTTQKPLITYFGKVDNYYFDPTLGMGVKRLLIVYPPLNKNFGHTFVQQCVQSKNKSFPVFADFQNLVNSAIIASKTKIDAIYATPTIAGLLFEFLEKYYDPDKIKLLALSSETLTLSRRQQLKKLYPKAEIANLYASSEIGQFILYPCKKIIKEEKDWFHILQPPVINAELVDDELVITYAANKAMPLIRYKTGDFFEVVREKCGCGVSGPVLSWSGREGVDKVRVGGVEIKVSDVERIFSQLGHLIGDGYQVHFYEVQEKSGIRIKIIVEIKEESVKAKFLSGENIKSAILNHLMNNWRLSQSSNLKDAINKKAFLTPEIKFVKEFSHNDLKARRLVSHLDKR